MTRAGKVKRYWSGIKNVRARVNRTDKIGVNARKEIFERTGEKKYKETNFKKLDRQNKKYALKDVRKSMSTIMKDRNEGLKKEFKRLKREGKVKGNFKDFAKANEPSDFNEVQELFNSPT